MFTKNYYWFQLSSGVSKLKEKLNEETSLIYRLINNKFQKNFLINLTTLLSIPLSNKTFTWSFHIFFLNILIAKHHWFKVMLFSLCNKIFKLWWMIICRDNCKTSTSSLLRSFAVSMLCEVARLDYMMQIIKWQDSRTVMKNSLRKSFFF